LDVDVEKIDKAWINRYSVLIAFKLISLAQQRRNGKSVQSKLDFWGFKQDTITQTNESIVSA